MESFVDSYIICMIYHHIYDLPSSLSIVSSTIISDRDRWLLLSTYRGSSDAPEEPFEDESWVVRLNRSWWWRWWWWRWHFYSIPELLELDVTWIYICLCSSEKEVISDPASWMALEVTIMAPNLIIIPPHSSTYFIYLHRSYRGVQPVDPASRPADPYCAVR